MADRDRERILERVRDSLKTAFLPGMDGVIHSVPPSKAPEREEMIATFVDELRELGATVYREGSEGAVRERVRSLVTGKKILTWDLSYLPYGLGEVLRQEELIFGGDSREIKERAAVGLTGVHAALACTGSLVMISAPGLPRTASLLPPAHVAVVRPGDILPDLESFLSEKSSGIGDTSCITLVTGPSRTADIELAITLGVHGPGELVVILGP